MSTASGFYKKVFKEPTLSQVTFTVAVLDKYLAQNGTTIKQTNTVGRIKTSTWSFDFGIAPDRNTIHATLGALLQKLPESEHEHWLSHVDEARFSENYLKMQGSHACIDDGNLRGWGEEAEESLFD